MPIFDLPLNELQQYQGVTPKPEDFEDYWDTALAEMHAIDPEVVMTPSAFQTEYADCFDLYFTGVGGARVYAKYLRPKQPAATPHPAVLEFHGYTGMSGDWYTKLPYVAAGYSVAALDCRGQGGRSEDVGGVQGNTQKGHIIRGLDDAPEKLLYRSIYLDTAQLAGIVMDMPEVEATRVAAMGASQGGALTLACAALEPRIWRAAPRCPFLCDYQRVWEMDLANDAYEELRGFFRRFDPRHERITEYWTRLGYIDNQHLAPRIRAEVLWCIGLMDQICPPSTQFAAYNKITSKKEMVIYPDFEHEDYPDFADKAFAFLTER